MTKMNLSAALLLSVGAATLSAQQPTTEKTGAATAVTLKGCVVDASGHYMLNRAQIVEPIPPVPTPTATGTTGSAAAPAAKNSDDQVYELIGANVKTHVGHQVEITGDTLPSEKAAGESTTANDLKREAHPIAGTVNVKAVKMLASSCPT